MKILQFKIGGDYDYNVVFETLTEKRKIQTNEVPRDELTKAVVNVVAAAETFFRFTDITMAFRQISFSYPQNAPQGFVLEMVVRSKENIYVTHTLKTEKLFLRSEDTASTNLEFETRMMQQNDLIEKIRALRDEIEVYAAGSKMQQELFEEDDTEEDDDITY